MIKNLLNKKNKKKAFTLIELIIVIAIIAILAAVAVPKYLEIKAKSNVKSDIANAKILHETIAELIMDDKITAVNVGDTELIPTAATGDVSKIMKSLDSKNSMKIKYSKYGNSNKNFFYNINSDGDITIKDSQNGKIIYPSPSGNSTAYSSEFDGNYR